MWDITFWLFVIRIVRLEKFIAPDWQLVSIFALAIWSTCRSDGVRQAGTGIAAADPTYAGCARIPLTTRWAVEKAGVPAGVTPVPRQANLPKAAKHERNISLQTS